jgi:HD-GYP domain-containing protein (c-di-GMP phosphodiesterase class II)
MNPDNQIFESLRRYTKALSVALGYRDLLTSLHSERVHKLSILIGRKCGLNAEETNILSISSSFHDIGKIGIPDHILLKPSALDEAEWETMRQHAEIGEKIMLSTELEGSVEAANIIRHHHEHHDGGGYPDGLSGEAIPLCSRITAIADSYDAMAVTRSYHKARTHAEIMEILAGESGTKHDPQLLRIFFDLIDNCPHKTE